MNGKSIVRQIENSQTLAGDKPTKDVIITDCGELEGDAAVAADVKQPDPLGDAYEDFPDDCNEELSADKILTIATACKEFGTKAFKAGNLEIGLEKYQKGLRYLNEDPDLDDAKPETIASLSTLRFSLNSNAALLASKLSQWDDTIRHATSALAVPNLADKERAKALYRRGYASVRVKDDEVALADLEKAHSLVPDDAAVKNELASVKAKITARTAKEKAAYQKFFA